MWGILGLSGISVMKYRESEDEISFIIERRFKFVLDKHRKVFSIHLADEHRNGSHKWMPVGSMWSVLKVMEILLDRGWRYEHRED